MKRIPGREVRATALMALAAVALGSNVALSQPQEPGWRLVPRIGSYWLDFTDGAVFSHGTGSIRQETVVGASVEFDTPVSWLGFRVSADRTVGAEAFVSGTGTIGVTTRGLAIEALLQPTPGSWRVRPFALLGTGAVLLEFERARNFSGDSRVHGAFHYGGGIDVDLGPLPLRLEGLHRHYESETDSPSPVVPPRERSIDNVHAVFTIGIRLDVR